MHVIGQVSEIIIPPLLIIIHHETINYNMGSLTSCSGSVYAAIHLSLDDTEIIVQFLSR